MNVIIFADCPAWDLAQSIGNDHVPEEGEG